MNDTTFSLLSILSDDFNGTYNGAFNIRENSQCAEEDQRKILR